MMFKKPDPLPEEIIIESRPLNEVRHAALKRIRRKYRRTLTESQLRALDRFGRMSTKRDLPFRLKKWIVDWIRHNLTPYDSVMNELSFWGPNICRMYKKYILDAIAEAYPVLADECARQGGESACQ